MTDEDRVPLYESGPNMAAVASYWRAWRKVENIRAMKMNGPFRVRTANGEIVSGEDGDYLCCSADGDTWPHHSPNGEFEQKYEEVAP